MSITPIYVWFYASGSYDFRSLSDVLVVFSTAVFSMHPNYTTST